jgi:hypothetical protein
MFIGTIPDFLGAIKIQFSEEPVVVPGGLGRFPAFRIA